MGESSRNKTKRAKSLHGLTFGLRLRGRGAALVYAGLTWGFLAFTSRFINGVEPGGIVGSAPAYLMAIP